ncbi:4-alpha-glucanotransferase [Marinagarivorans algicola]|uniref:4-alpha-glucanotransferase n=1 Tax=Marinagarivorans algicola TaxID=1513270 RepID=UPI0006B8D5E4|nr:4-alpha-glucanotransferase [Marinagarivorans algicola]
METLNQLMYWRGIASDYFNYKGERVEISLNNRKALVRAMGIDPDDLAAVASAAYTLDVEPWTRWIQTFQVVEQHKECCFFVSVAPSELNQEFSYSIELENGTDIKGVFTPSAQPEVGDYLFEGIRYSRRVIMCGALPLGYHRLTLLSAGHSLTGQLAVVPEQGFVPADIHKGKRVWGFIVQLYTLRTDRNWGIGDLTDLKYLLLKAADFGADIVGLNPLHVLRTPNEYHCSPYSPSDRRFIEPLYIDPEVIDEFAGLSVPSAQLVQLRADKSVNYAAVYDVKFAVFKSLYRQFKRLHLQVNTQRAERFLQYVEREGHALQDYCSYQVLTNSGTADLWTPNLALSTEQQDEADFYAYLQWQAQVQMASCQELAQELHLTIGLMRDLAVGADGGGSEVTTNQRLFCREAAVGAPPDPLAEKGQNWGLPPMDPAHLRQTDFEHFINLLRTNMANCGALRIDHAMSLMRLWWCPPGHTADYGAYVYYPFTELLGLLKLESVRSGCMIIGEDMGVVPDEFREAIISGSVFTNKLFYFEREHDGDFKLPEHYMPRALAMLTNHDVPTLASWWAGSDIELRANLNLLDDSVPLDQVKQERTNDKYRLLRWLERCGIHMALEPDVQIQQPMTEDLMGEILACGAKVASQIFVIQLDDLELLDAPVNVPGTSTEYANWQRKLTVNLDTLFARESVIATLNKVANARP